MYIGEGEVTNALSALQVAKLANRKHAAQVLTGLTMQVSVRECESADVH